MNPKRNPVPLFPSAFPRNGARALLFALSFGTSQALAVVSSIAGPLSLSEEFYENQALSLAEAGLDEAMQFFESEGSDGWEISGGNARLTVSNLAVGHGATGAIDVLIEDFDGRVPIVTAEGRVTPDSGPATIKKLRRPNSSHYFPFFGLGITAQCKVVFHGGNSSIQSYRSSEGYAGDYSIRRDRASVAARSIESDRFVPGRGHVWGHVFTGGNPPMMGAGGTIQGEDSVQEPIDWRRVGMNFAETIPRFRDPPAPLSEMERPKIYLTELNTWIEEKKAAGTLPASRIAEHYVEPGNFALASDGFDAFHRVDLGHVTSPTIIGIPEGSAPEYSMPPTFSPLIVYADSINLTGGDIRIVGRVILVVLGDVKFSGGGRLVVGFERQNTEQASLMLFAYGDVSFGGSGGMVNMTSSPGNLGILGMAPDVALCSSGQSFDLGGNAQWSAIVYAPNAAVRLNGGGSSGIMSGVVIGMTITFGGGSNFFYDEDAESLLYNSNIDMAPWEPLGPTVPPEPPGEEGQSTLPELSDLSFRLHFANTRSVPPQWKVRPRWNVSAQIQTSDPAWESLVVVSSPGGQMQAFLNHPDGLDSRSLTFDKFESMVNAISGTWTIDIHPGGENARRFLFTVDADDLPENQFAHFGIDFPAIRQTVTAEEFRGEWSQPAAGTWDGLNFQLYQLNPYGLGFSGLLEGTEQSLSLPALSTSGQKRLAIGYSNDLGGFPEIVVGTPYSDLGPAPFTWQVGTPTSLSRSSRDFSVISLYQRWLATHLVSEDLDDPGVSDLLASPGGDGLTNLEKYALGLTPYTYDSSRLPLPGVIPAEQPGGHGYLTLTFRVVSDDPALSFEVDVSSDLQSWIAGSEDGEVETQVNDNGDGTAVVTARFPRKAGQGRRFLRLRLTYD